MRSTSLLRKLGWNQIKGKWASSDHSRPLTLEQAKNALARDLGKKNFDSLKKSGKLDDVADLANRGFKLKDKQFRRNGKGKKWNLEGAINRAAKDDGFKSAADKKRIEEIIKEPLFKHYEDKAKETGNDLDEVKKKYAAFRKRRTKKTLSDLLIASGYRTGYEPYAAGETP